MPKGVSQELVRWPPCRPGSAAWVAPVPTRYRDAGGQRQPGAKPGSSSGSSGRRWRISSSTTGGWTPGQRLAVTHGATGTKLRVLSSSGKRAMGLSQFHTIYADEPASYEVRGGALMFDALRQSLGKRPGQRLVTIGTRAPSEDGSWWPSLLDGGSGARNACNRAHGARGRAVGRLEHDQEGQPSRSPQPLFAEDDPSRTR